MQKLGRILEGAVLLCKLVHIFLRHFGNASIYDQNLFEVLPPQVGNAKFQLEVLHVAIDYLN